MPNALDLLKTRRSVKPLDLAGPGPSAAELETLLTIAARVPDHGKLVPWRFLVFQADARLVAGAAIATAFKADTFDAKKVAGGKAADGHIAKWGATRRARFLEAAAPLLTPDQRTKLAQTIRDRAANTST